MTRCAVREQQLLAVGPVRPFDSTVQVGVLACSSINGPGTSGRRDIVQTAITFTTAVAGLIFSVAVALLAEEFIFGQVIRVFFVRQTAAVKASQKR